MAFSMLDPLPLLLGLGSIITKVGSMTSQVVFWKQEEWWYFFPEFSWFGTLGIKSFKYCWFSHDVTKIQTTKVSILLRFYFHGVLEQLNINFQTNFRFKRVLGFVIECAWISKLLRDAAFTWRPRELSIRLKKWLFSRNFGI